MPRSGALSAHPGEGVEVNARGTEIRLDTNWVDYLILAIYFVAVLGIGFAAKRYIKTSLDYFLSGRSLPAWITGLAFISANLGALEILGMAANGAQFGVYTVHYYWIGAVPAMVFLGIVMMPFYYGSKVRSRAGVPAPALQQADAPLQRADVRVRDRADRRREPVRAGAGAQADARLADPARHRRRRRVVLVYITLGGLSSAIYNEVLQFFVILAALIPLTIVGLHDVGGWDGLKDAVRRSTTSDQPASTRGRARGSATSTTRSAPRGSPIVFGLGFVLSFGYWTTNFAEVQRALSRQEPERRAAHAADRRLPEDLHPGDHDHPRPRRAGHDPAASAATTPTWSTTTRSRC